MVRKKATDPIMTGDDAETHEGIGTMTAAPGLPPAETNEGKGNGNGNVNEIDLDSPFPPLPRVRTGTKAPRSTFYMLSGRSLDGRSLDVLGEYATRNQAMKALESMAYVVTRNYKEVRVLQCRDKTGG